MWDVHDAPFSKQCLHTASFEGLEAAKAYKATHHATIISKGIPSEKFIFPSKYISRCT